MITWALDTSHWEGTKLPIINKIIAKTGKVNNQLLGLVDYQKAYAAGCRSALIKATDGVDNVDPVYQDSYQDCDKANLVTFPFHFYEEQDWNQQVTWFIFVISGHFSGVPVIDYEIKPKNPAYVLSSLVSIGNSLQAAFSLKPLIYTSPYYLSLFGSLDLSPLLVYNLWLAWWNPGFITGCYPWAGYLARQWTSKGKLPGVSSSVDLDYLLDTPQNIVSYSKT